MMSFINAFQASQFISKYDKVASEVWHGLAPTKAELLVWLLIRGRLNTKERLHRLNIMRNDGISCPLCNSEVESIFHLIFFCNFVWKLWGVCCLWWGVSWILGGYPSKNFDA